MVELRSINYSVHCAFKHITGAIKGLKEFQAKVSREVTKLSTTNKLSENDKPLIKEILQKLHDILIELNDIAFDIFNMERKGTDVNILVALQTSIATIRIQLEKILITWINFLESKGYNEKDLGPHFYELLEVLADLYKIEQDHFPELMTLKKEKAEENKDK